MQSKESIPVRTLFSIPERNGQMDFTVKLAEGMGMNARRASTAEEFTAALQHAFSTKGPHLIDAIVPPEFDGLKLRALPMGLEALQRIPSPIAKTLKKKLGL